MNSPGEVNIFPPYPIGSSMTSLSIVEVIRIGDIFSTFKMGDLLLGYLPVQEYHTVPEEAVKQFTPLPDNNFGLDPSLFLGPLGNTGLVAYASLYHYIKPKRGETLLISAASGAVGHILGQLAKREGMKVLGIAGSEKKVSILTQKLKFDGAINYKNGDFLQNLKALAPKGVDGKNIYIIQQSTRNWCMLFYYITERRPI